MKLLAQLAVVFLLSSGSARAEIAVLTNGHTFKIDSYRVEGSTAYLGLRGGGEVGAPVSLVKGVVPDEIVDAVLEAVVQQVRVQPEFDLQQLIDEVARQHGMDPELVRAVVRVESAFQADAVSHKGARGLMQLMPATARELGVEDVFDPHQNLEAGTRHLRSLVEHYDGDLRKALAAYNAGTGAVSRYRGVPPYKETRRYVQRVLEQYEAAKGP